jgi:outer membrane receptor protein involved in Fe transport
MHRVLAAAAVVVAGLIAPSPARAEDAPAADPEQKALEEQIAKELGQGAVARPAPTGATPAAPPPATGASPYARLLALPDLSAIGRFAALWSDDDERLDFQFQELELGLQAVVDPYLRADLFIAFGEEGASVEEGFVTTTSLPAGLQVKAGQLFSPFGRLNGQHPHSWDFVDAPLASGRLVAEEVLSGPGLDLSWLAPLPWFAELHVAAQSTEPAPGDGRNLTGLVRVAQFVGLGEGTTLGVGLSGALRDEGAGTYRQLGGADLLLRWRPPAGRSSLTLQGELFGRRFTESGGGSHVGGYAQLHWRRGPHLGLGARYDQAPGADLSGTERRYSAVGTWSPSEFQRLRLQLSRDERPGGAGGWGAILQAEFGIGAHGAHPF